MTMQVKDMYNMSDSFFEFYALFSTHGVLINNCSYKCGEIITEFLNYDSLEAMQQIQKMGEIYDLIRERGQKTYKEFRANYSKLQDIANHVNKLIYKMPLYRNDPKGLFSRRYLRRVFFVFRKKRAGF